MTSADTRALKKLLGKGERAASTDDLQNLLLQVVLALLMVFMIAYFIFIENQKKMRAEEIMALNRQKLELALEKVSEDHRVRYGLNALMTQGIDGKRTFEPETHIRAGRIVLSPAAQAAFSQGAKAAFADYADSGKTTTEWKKSVLSEAGLAETSLEPEVSAWFNWAVEKEVENVRRDVRGVQRSLAARLLYQWVKDPSSLDGITDVTEIAAELRKRSLELVSEATGSEVLP